MKTAIIYSGQTRTFRHVLKNQWWMVLRRFSDAHVFASVADDADAGDMELLKERFPADRVHIERVAQPDCLPLLGFTEETAQAASLGAPMSISSPPEAILRQLWHLNRARALVAQVGGEFEEFVRIRPDLHFHRFILPGAVRSHECISPWWGGYGGINDRFALMGWAAFNDYFGTWAKLPALLAAGCPLHPESLVAASLEQGGSKSWRSMQSEFSAVRPNGQLVWPDMHLYDLSK